MKIFKLIVISTLIFFSTNVQAQVAVSVTIGSPPAWGPVGYAEERYYYLPDVEAYYDVHTSMFIYYQRGVWVHRGHLPGHYRNYDLYGGYKVVMTGYRGNAPYDNFREYRTKYVKGYRGEAQRTNRERPAKGNSNARVSHEDKRSNGAGHEKNMKKDHGHGEKNGKRK